MAIVLGAVAMLVWSHLRLRHTASQPLAVSLSMLRLGVVAYSYLQEYLPHVAQWAVRNEKVDAVGIGRAVLSYPTLPADVLEKGALDPKRLCRTFSDCTTGPRHGLVSGCYPLDPYYKGLPEAQIVRKVKAGLS